MKGNTTSALTPLWTSDAIYAFKSKFRNRGPSKFRQKILNPARKFWNYHAHYLLRTAYAFLLNHNDRRRFRAIEAEDLCVQSISLVLDEVHQLSYPSS